MLLSYAHQIEYARTEREIDEVLSTAKSDSDIDDSYYQVLKKKSDEAKKWVTL